MAATYSSSTDSTRHSTLWLLRYNCEQNNRCFMEQVSMCIRHVDEEWNIYEDFVGMYANERTDATTLTKIVTDIYYY